MACRSHVGLAESFENIDLPPELVGRFTIKHAGMMCKGGVHIASAYFHTGLELHHQKNHDMLQAIAAVLATVKGPWILCADWQNTPDDLQKTGWLKMVSGSIAAPEMTTCHNRTIDFSWFLIAWQARLEEPLRLGMRCASRTSRSGCTLMRDVDAR